VVRVAVNQEHVDLDHPVHPGDEVAFFPPVTGG
jgi:molybdopterin synthase sulfur carrier subunit